MFTCICTKTLQLKQRQLYGSTRLGVITEEVRIAENASWPNVLPTHDTANSPFVLWNADSTYQDSVFINPFDSVGYKIKVHKYLGYRNYELSNHLSNVLAVISDRKYGEDADTDGELELFKPNVLSETDYYAFGSEVKERSVSGGYRYGFNGQMKDDEIYGAGNANTAMFWEYDTRLGRRWNLDPKPAAGVSSYVPFNNNPILNSDPLGDTTYLFNRAGIFKGVILDKLTTNEIVVISDKNYNLLMNVKGHNANTIARTARNSMVADARITQNTAAELSKQWTSSRSENAGLLSVDPKTKEAKVEICPSCKKDIVDIKKGGEADARELAFFEDAMKGKTFIANWHSHPENTMNGSKPSPGDFYTGENSPSLQNGGIGLIVNQSTITLFGLYNSSTQKVPQMSENAASPMLFESKDENGGKRTGQSQNATFSARSLSPVTKWKK